MALEDVEWAGLLWHSDDGYRPAPLLSADVEIQVTGMVARARVTQRFANPGDDWIEGVYLFPLPDEAAVDRLRMVVGSRILEGQIKEKEEARQVYETARAEGRKATLVERHRPNVFSTRVANVGPGEQVEVVLELQQPVRYADGEMSLRFPTVVNPRFFPGPVLGDPATAPQVGIAPPLLADAGDPLPGSPSPAVAPHDQRGVLHDGFALAADVVRQTVGGVLGTGVAQAAESQSPGDGSLLQAAPPPTNPLTFAVTLDAGFPLDYLDAPYHAVDVAPLGHGRYRVALAHGAVDADRDFELVWAPRPGAEPRSALFTEEHGGDTYALLMMLPPDAGAGGWVPLDRELVFILDVSGSMAGASLDQAKQALGAVLDGLQPRDSFNVIAFSDEAQALFPDSLAASGEAVDKARQWVGSLQADGGTNMLPALAAALEQPRGYRSPGTRSVKQVIFLTDGAVGNEADLFAYIAAHLGAARLFTVGIGAAPNAWFMQRAAEEGRGTYTFIGDPSEVALKVQRLAAKLEGPVLTDLEVEWQDPSAEVWPQRLGDLYAGEPLVVAARTYRPGDLGDAVVVRGRRDGSYWEQSVPLVRAAETFGDGPTAGVRQLWAQRKIAGLMATLASGAEPDEVRRAVVEVALAHHLVSQYTSLVAVDVTPSRPAGEAVAGRNVPLATPAGWVPPGSLPVGATAWPAQLASGLACLVLALLVLGATSEPGRRLLAMPGRWLPRRAAR